MAEVAVSRGAHNERTPGESGCMASRCLRGSAYNSAPGHVRKSNSLNRFENTGVQTEKTTKQKGKIRFNLFFFGFSLFFLCFPYFFHRIFHKGRIAKNTLQISLPPPPNKNHSLVDFLYLDPRNSQVISNSFRYFWT